MDKHAFPLEIKSFDAETGTFVGFASIYGNEDLHGDIVEKGAFTRTLKSSNTITLLWQHNPNEPIGVGLLEDSAKGLKITGTLNMEVVRAREGHALLRQGAIKGLSIGYDTKDADYDEGRRVRILKEISLWEVSLVTFPANPKAKVTRVKNAVDLPWHTEAGDFNPDAAYGRVRKWADTEGNELSDAHLVATQGAPRFLLGDIIAGDLKLNPAAVQAAAIALDEAKGDFAADDLKTLTASMDSIIAKMNEATGETFVAPWAEAPKDADHDTGMERLLRRVVTDATLKSLDGVAMSPRNLKLVDGAIEALTKLQPEADEVVDDPPAPAPDPVLPDPEADADPEPAPAVLTAEADAVLTEAGFEDITAVNADDPAEGYSSTWAGEGDAADTVATLNEELVTAGATESVFAFDEPTDDGKSFKFKFLVTPEAVAAPSEGKGSVLNMAAWLTERKEARSAGDGDPADDDGTGDPDPFHSLLTDFKSFTDARIPRDGS